MRQRKIITHKTIFTLFGNLPTSIEFAGISLLSGKNSKVFSKKKKSKPYGPFGTCV